MKTQLTKTRSKQATNEVAKKASTKNTEASSRNSRRKPGKVEEPSTDFGKTLQSLLGKKQSDQKVSEEEIMPPLSSNRLRISMGTNTHRTGKLPIS
jgi:L,D-peptidoglycan transpeptidase YkuD (ErfK/YbiS/YcfS/YnhG family)